MWNDAAMSAPPIVVRQIDHVTLVVKDLEASSRFYGDVLGMRDVPRPGFRFVGKWLQAGTTQIHLILEHEQSGPPQVTFPEQCSISRTRHFAFEVDDALAAQARLAELGIPLAAGPQSRPDGPTQIYILDPDRHVVELFSHRRE